MDKQRKKEIGARVEKVRQTVLNNISQNKLGKEIGMTGQSIGSVINGKGSFSLDKAIEFCEYANVSMDYVFRGKENNLIDVAKVNEAIINFNNKNK